MWVKKVFGRLYVGIWYRHAIYVATKLNHVYISSAWKLPKSCCKKEYVANTKVLGNWSIISLQHSSFNNVNSRNNSRYSACMVLGWNWCLSLHRGQWQHCVLLTQNELIVAYFHYSYLARYDKFPKPKLHCNLALEICSYKMAQINDNPKGALKLAGRTCQHFVTM